MGELATTLLWRHPGRWIRPAVQVRVIHFTNHCYTKSSSTGKVMVNVLILSQGQRLPRCGAWIACALLLSCSFVPALRGAEDPQLRQLVEQMFEAKQQQGYDPQPLMKRGLPGMRFVLDELFPELNEQNKQPVQKVAALIEQLNDQSYERREEATFALRRMGWSAEEQLRQALDHENPQVRTRLRKILANTSSSFKPRNNFQGLQKYLGNQRDADCRQELARRVTAALAARLDKTEKLKAIMVCLECVSKSLGDRAKDDRIQSELLPLLELEDSAPALLALQKNPGDESYVTPILKAALASKRPELIRCGVLYMMNPRWDEANRPIIKAELEKYFDGSPVPAELRNDLNFMFRVASIAHEEFQSANAQEWLIGLISSKQPVALPVMRSLGIRGIKLKPMDAKLFAAVEPHAKSKEEKYRAAAAEMLEVYEGEGVLPLLVQLFADPAEEVWKKAAESLHQRHYSSYERGKSPIPQLLENALQTAAEDAHKARLKYLIKNLQPKNITVLRWKDIE